MIKFTAGREEREKGRKGGEEARRKGRSGPSRRGEGADTARSERCPKRPTSAEASGPVGPRTKHRL